MAIVVKVVVFRLCCCCRAQREGRAVRKREVQKKEEEGLKSERERKGAVVWVTKRGNEKKLRSVGDERRR